MEDGALKDALLKKLDRQIDENLQGRLGVLIVILFALVGLIAYGYFSR